MMTLDELLALFPDNDSGAIDADDLRTLVTEIYTLAASVDARVSDLEENFVGGGGYTVAGVWAYNSTVGSTPATGTFTLDAVLPSTTLIKFHKTDKNGLDAAIALDRAVRLYLQEQANADRWARFNVSGDVTIAGNVVTVPVTQDGYSTPFLANGVNAQVVIKAVTPP